MKISISLFGVAWDLLAITVFLLATFLTTHFFKKIIKIHPVFLSWIFAIPIFVIVGLLFPEVKNREVEMIKTLTLWGVIQYLFLTLLLNGVYKGSTLLWDFLASKFTFIKKREKHRN